jgi:hypothetical protein
VGSVTNELNYQKPDLINHMQMKPLQAILSLSLMLLLACNQKKSYYNFHEINWSINVPEDYDIDGPDEVEEAGNKSKKAFEYIDSTIDFSTTKNLITIRKGELNYFTAAITPFDARKTDWNISNNNVKTALVKGFKVQLPSVGIDSATTKIIIQNLEFSKFDLNLKYLGNNTVHIIIYSKLYKGYDFGVVICYTDDELGKDLNNIFLNSSFEQKD